MEKKEKIHKTIQFDSPLTVTVQVKECTNCHEGSYHERKKYRFFGKLIPICSWCGNIRQNLLRDRDIN
jgi:hypothetical protein